MRALRTPILGLVWLATFALCGPARADYDLARNVLAGGGGESGAGGEILAGTIGQFAPGILAGGTYGLRGGFWALVEVPSLPTLTPTPTATRIATPPSGCLGDTNSDGRVTVNELVAGVRCALRTVDSADCAAFDADGDGGVAINELVLAVKRALSGCPTPVATPTRTPGGFGPIFPAVAESALAPAPLLHQQGLYQPPSLAAADAADAVTKVTAFIAWACACVEEEREDGRRMLAAARPNPFVAPALIDEARRALDTDPTRAFLILSLLGELRHPDGEAFLTEILWMPPLTDGPVEVESGQPLRAQSLAILQGKAVDGLAYLRTESDDAQVLRAMSEHSSRAVRAEAIAAYLWNHGDSPGARQAVLRAVLPEERFFVDRPAREEGDSAPSVDALLVAHPVLVPPESAPGEQTSIETNSPDDSGTPPTQEQFLAPACGTAIGGGVGFYFHGPHPTQGEFLCDVKQFAAPDVPIVARDLAQAGANTRGAEGFINDPGDYCGTPRPW